jgi:hypothetical protein
MTISVILGVQLALAILCPPIPIGTHKLFLSDAWAIVWVSGIILSILFFPKWLRMVGLEKLSDYKATLLRSVLVTASLALIIWAHGATRPSLVPFLEKIPLTIAGSDLFQPYRELYIALRFGTWILGFQILAVASRINLIDRDRLFRAGQGIMLAASLGLVGTATVPSLRAFAGQIYGYDPTYFPWIERSYGTFASPVEGAAAMACALVIFGSRSMAFPIIGGLGLFFTRTWTPLFSLVGGTAVAWLTRRGQPSTRASSVLCGLVVLSLLAAVALYLQRHHLPPEVAVKIANVLFRIEVWRTYVLVAASKWHWFLLGFGFLPYHADSALFFVFSRAGLVGAGLFLFWAGRAAWTNFWTSALPGKVLIAYLIVSNLTTDAIFFRPLIPLLWVAIGIGIFGENSESKTHSVMR